ncbi:MAG: hypothetical protein ABI616_15105 [Pseudomonadota bacterium]
MNSKSAKWFIGTAAALGLAASTVALAADPAPAPTATPAAKKVPTSNKWRVEFDGRADMDGEIVFAIIVGDTTTTITTKIKKGTSENSVASQVVKELKKQAPPKQFHFETDDGEAVYFKKKVGMGVPNFGVQLVSSNVTGINIKVKKD